MNFEEKIKTTQKEVTENSDMSSKNLKSELKKKITTPSKRRRKISKSVEKSSTRSTTSGSTIAADRV